MLVNRFITIGLLLTIFVSSFVFFKTPFEAYLSYIVYVILLPFFISKFGVPRSPLLLFLPLLMVGMYQILMGNNTPALFFKVFTGLFVASLFYYYIMRAFELDVDKLFKLYLHGAIVVSAIGLFQFFSFQVGFTPGYNYDLILNKWGITIGGNFGIRINSIFSEPSQYAIIMAPAACVALNNLIGPPKYIGKRVSVMILVTYLLTFSTVGFIGLFIMGLLLLINYRYIRQIIIGVPLSILTGVYLYNNVSEFKERIDSSYMAFFEQQYVGGKINQSSLVQYNNYFIAKENFKRHFLLGTGLGSHPLAFDKYTLTRQKGVLDVTFNTADANSMFLRLMSETGLYGLVVIFYIIFKYYVPKKLDAEDDNSWLISNAFLVLILLFLVRQGHYFINGFPFFVWVYYYNSIKRSEALAATDEEEALVQPEA